MMSDRNAAHGMRRLLTATLFCLTTTLSASANEPMLDAALRSARDILADATPQLAASTMGVDAAAYSAALIDKRAPNGRLQFVIQERGNGSCSKFAAYVGRVEGSNDTFLFLCPQFFSPGADRLRVTTLLHEVVHVVAGPDECRAMAYTAHLEMLAEKRFQPVDAYWRSNDCAASRYGLPR